ncbi:MAG: hypothetical protein CMF11_08620 [Idiomarina sp.]|nr:hypothetical protein [Idiomarina sp.]
MNDPFAAHDVTHLSASAINEYIANPARWILHVSGYRDNLGIPAMWRGIAVDKALSRACFDTSVSEAQIIQWAFDEFDTRLEDAKASGATIFEAKVATERDNLTRYMQPAIPHFRQLGVPLASQKKIKLEFEELPIPIIGYLDLLYDGVVRDIKSVNRLPSKVPDATSRQLAIYAAAEECTPVIDYVHATKTQSQVVVKPVLDIEHHMMVVRRAALNMMNLLSYSSDIQQVASLLVPDLDDWRWSDGEREAARELWRI